MINLKSLATLLPLGSILGAMFLTNAAVAQERPLPVSPKSATPEAVYAQDYTSYSQFLAQINSISQLRDVSPQDWSYEALRNLVENYGCIVGYPDQTYRGTRPLSRNEFAAGLNACLTQLEKRMLDSRQQLTATSAGTTQTLRPSVQPGEPLGVVFNRAFYHNTGRFYDISSISGQANNIFGWRTFPGSFFDNQIRADALVVETLYDEALRQQTAGTNIRTQDLGNPFNSSIQGNPGYLRLGNPSGN